MSALVNLISYLRSKPNLLMGLFTLMLGVFVLFDAFATRHGAHFAGDKVVGFWAIFGFGGTIIMTKFMKWFAHEVLIRPLDFYEKKEGEE
ncbi:MAG: hypothetical protein C0609_12215 [Deltaproteobacteria bacterium]|nr:MAG: hypothetical protein C0609_12215 [Deltaproteobacteria bacterium]